MAIKAVSTELAGQTKAQLIGRGGTSLLLWALFWNPPRCGTCVLTGNLLSMQDSWCRPWVMPPP